MRVNSPAFKIFIVCLSLLCADAWAEVSTDFTGRIFTTHYYRIHSPPKIGDSQFSQNSLTTWLEGGVTFTDELDFHAVGLGSVFLNNIEKPNVYSMDADAREFYLRYQTTALEIKAGQLILPWGKSDGVNPTDYFTAKDYTFFNPNEEVRRIGASSVYISYTPDEGTSPLQFSWVVQGRNPQMKMLIPDSSTVQTVPFVRYPESGSWVSSSTLQTGFKIAWLDSSYDFSVSAFRGRSQMPFFNYDGTKVFAQYVRQTSVGADASWTMGDNIFRVESAGHLPDNGKCSDCDSVSASNHFAVYQPWRIETVVGIERPVVGDFRAQIQLLHRAHLYYQSPDQVTDPNPLLQQLWQQLARANARLLNYQNKNFYGATFRINYLPDDDWVTGDVYLVGYFREGQDYLLKTQVKFKPITNTHIIVGFDLYGGDQDKTLGSLRTFSNIFSEFSWMF